MGYVGNDSSHIRGEYYDWRKTQAPERPYIHEYHKTLTMKMGMAIPDNHGGCKVFCTFAEALERIKRLDVITYEIPKIIYLVGWQYEGHDDKFPAWHEVNRHLKRPEDDTALESLVWLMREAKKYHTTVSLHINMTDAYPISPLWNEYVEKGLISKKRNGKLFNTGTWNGRTAYQICYTKEWELGYAQKRINELLELLPLQEAGTVHIDAFFCRPNRGEGITLEEEQATRRKIIRYWRDKGIDVTTEFLYQKEGAPALIGLVPMIWWINQSNKDYLERPASLLTGGKPNKKLARYKHCLHRVWGKSVHGEDLWKVPNPTQKDIEACADRFLDQFCRHGMSWYLFNSRNRLGFEGFLWLQKALYQGNLESSYMNRRITDNGRVIKDGTDTFLPALWRDDPEIIAYSKKGYKKKVWTLPSEWHGYPFVIAYKLRVYGLGDPQEIPIHQGNIELTLGAGEAVVIRR